MDVGLFGHVISRIALFLWGGNSKAYERSPRMLRPHLRSLPRRLAIAFKTLAETKGLLKRYETGYRREYNKALSMLRDLIRERKNTILRVATSEAVR